MSGKARQGKPREMNMSMSREDGMNAKEGYSMYPTIGWPILFPDFSRSTLGDLPSRESFWGLDGFRSHFLLTQTGILLAWFFFPWWFPVAALVRGERIGFVAV